MAYIDTSVLVAYYCPEALSSRIQPIVESDGARTISPLVEVELCAALAMKVRTRELDKSAGARIITLLEQHVADGRYRVVPIAAPEYSLARRWVAQFSTSLRAPDALHLAAASGQSLTVLTADRGLARAAKDLGVDCQLIE